MAAAFPDWVEPMAATLTQERFTGPEWTFERKLDGIRLLAFKQGRDVRLLSRNKLPLNGAYPSVVEAIAALPADELIPGRRGDRLGPGGQSGVPLFSTSCGSMAATSCTCRSTRVAICCASLPLQPPLERVAALDDAAPWERACREGWEGVVAKRRDSVYEHPALAALAEDEVEGDAGAGDRWLHRSAGRSRGPWRAARGVSSRARTSSLPARSAPGSTTRCSWIFALAWTRWRSRRRRSPNPSACRASARIGCIEIVVQVAFLEWTVHGKLRHPRLLGVGIDKMARDVVRDQS